MAEVGFEHALRVRVLEEVSDQTGTHARHPPVQELERSEEEIESLAWYGASEPEKRHVAFTRGERGHSGERSEVDGVGHRAHAPSRHAELLPRVARPVASDEVEIGNVERRARDDATVRVEELNCG